MKKLIPIVSLSAIFLMVCLFTASSQQGKGNGKEKTQKGNTNANVANSNAGNGKAQPNKVNQGKVPADQKQKGKENRNDKRENANNDKRENANKSKGNADDKIGKGYNGKNENENSGEARKMKNGKKDKDYYNSVFGYNWNNENFKERKKLRKQDKVSICHKFSSKNDGVNINVSENAVKAHLNHGDVIGDCPMFNDRRYSNGYYDNRNNYYNNLQNTQEQVYYSQSVLDYALARLTNSRTQLQVMQNNRLPAADIQRKQQSVVQLEQNVSLLETLIGVAVAVVGDQL